jgi:DNA-binding beta-propeller fold protein YncE/mono/diheme cytochrome c family protein
MISIRQTALILTVIAGLLGCQQGLDDNRYPTGSTSMISTAQYDAVVTANVDEGTITRLHLLEFTEADEPVEVGLQPTRIARIGEDTMLVTLRGERAFAVIDTSGATMSVTQKIATGAEPYGIVASEDGSRIYVAASREGVVQEFDGGTFDLLRSFEVDDEPRWLALHPNGASLYVGSVFGGTISHVDLDDGQVTAHLPPRVTGMDPNDSSLVTLTPRVTGDPAVHPNGRYLAVPVLHVDNTTKGPDLSTGVTIPGQGYYVQDNGSRFRPGIAAIPLDADGNLVPVEGETVDLTVFDAGFDQVGSYPSAVIFSSDGSTMVVPMESSDIVVAVDAEEIGGLGAGLAISTTAAGVGGLTQRTNVVVRTGAGPKAVATLNDNVLYVHTWLADRVAALELAPILEKLSSVDAGAGRSGTGTLSIIDGDQLETPEGAVVSDLSIPGNTERQGRRLFYSATDSTMVMAGAGVSCSTCHFEGRNDGLTWPFSDPFGPRQTPSLAGTFGETRPVTWDSDVTTVAEEANTTSSGRMGGRGPNAGQAAAIEAFVNSVALPELRIGGVDSAAIARGAALFGREDVGCADCHDPQTQYTDGEIHAMYGLDTVRTRSLEGLAATAPYLHDGSAETISDLLVRLRNGVMGDTSSLSEAERADLEAFLLSL